MKKWMSVLLSMVLLVKLFSVSALAAEKTEAIGYRMYSADAELVEAVKDGAKVRSRASKHGDVVVRCDEGTVMEVLDKKLNKHLHVWYKVSVQGQEGYIYSDNVEKHEHDYRVLADGDAEFHYCHCGTVKVVTRDGQDGTELQVKVANAAGLAVAAAAVDGPLPVGDVMGATLLAALGLSMLQDPAQITSLLTDGLQSMDFDEYMASKKNQCSVDSYRRVITRPQGLQYMDDRCMDLAEAYLWVMFCGNVYTTTQENAALLASINPDGGFPEKDQGDNPTYFNHYHMGINRNGKHEAIIGYHIFYGVNDLGQGPFY